MNLSDCEKLNKKYDELITMVQESLDITLNEYKEKSKRNKFFLDYKKRVYEEIHKLKSKIKTEDKIIEEYNEEILALKKENFYLKNKFKHLSEIFKSNKEIELLNKYFSNKVELEHKLAKLIRKVLKEKFNPKEINVLYFRKNFFKVFNQYLIRFVKPIVGSEKLAIVISQIIKKEYKEFMNKILVKTLLDKIFIKEYEHFIEVLIKEDLVQKDKIYSHIEVPYNIDEIKKIIKNFNSLEKEEKIENISFKIELDEILQKKEELFNQKIDINTQLEELTKEEDELLAEIVSDESLAEENKKRLEKIDEEKRVLKNKIQHIDSEITKLANRELFITPLLEEKMEIDDIEKKYTTEYENLIDVFSKTIKDL